MRTVRPIQSFSTKPASSLPVETMMLGLATLWIWLGVLLLRQASSAPSR
jgi:hypothetical protein